MPPDAFSELLEVVLARHAAWRAAWGPQPPHEALTPDPQRLRRALESYLDRLGGNYPFFHARYAGQMLKPPHPVATLGYLAAQLINPNNHALDGGPPTSRMEKEATQTLGEMFGYEAPFLGHLTSGGTVANLEALWAARHLHPGKAVVHSEAAHYTHARMCAVLGQPSVEIPAAARGTLELEAVERLARAGKIGTLVVTAGTTGLGAVDPVADCLELAARYGFRVHADAAYGGFFRLLALREGALEAETARHLRALSGCDSIVVDPHKHGLQPYGCGCVLFKDPSVGRFYRHDSPYTYFTSDELHLGEISLECSRAGAAAGALWLTLQVFPPAADEGLGPILAACRSAARAWHGLLDASDVLRPYTAPELDIVTFGPRAAGRSAQAIDAMCRALFAAAMHDAEDPVFLSVLRVTGAHLAARWPDVQPAAEGARILRSVLMKPEHAAYAPALHARIAGLAEELWKNDA